MKLGVLKLFVGERTLEKSQQPTARQIGYAARLGIQINSTTSRNQLSALLRRAEWENPDLAERCYPPPLAVPCAPRIVDID